MIYIYIQTRHTHAALEIDALYSTRFFVSRFRILCMRGQITYVSINLKRMACHYSN